MFARLFGKEITSQSQSAASISILNVLIIDDDELFAKVIAKRVQQVIDKENAEASVLLAQNWEHVISSKSKSPHLVFLDYHLQHALNGEQVFDLVVKTYPAADIVMLSGQEDGTLVLRLMKKGLKSYLTKDKEGLEQLEDTILESLNRHLRS